MSWLIGLAQWILKQCERAISFAVSIPGLILAAFSSCIAVILNYILDLPFFTTLENALETVVQSASDMLSSGFLSSGLGKTLIYTVNLQQFLIASLAALGATFGALAYITISILGIILPLVITVFTIRAILKGISIASGGILSP